MIVDKGYIVAIERKDEKFGKVVELINNPPTAPSGYRYRLRADNLEWELVEIEQPAMTDEQALTRYANELTGADDPDLISAAETLIEQRIKGASENA